MTARSPLFQRRFCDPLKEPALARHAMCLPPELLWTIFSEVPVLPDTIRLPFGKRLPLTTS